MRFAFASVVAALAALVSAHTEPNYNLSPEGNAIIKPGLNEAVPVGKPYTVKWTPTTQGPISLVLLRGPSTNVKPLVTIAEQIPNDGSFTWTPSTELEPDVTHYGLLLVVEGSGQYQYSTQFGISNPDFNNGGKPSNPPQEGPITTATVVNPPAGTETAVITMTTTECLETTEVPTGAPTTIPVSVNTSSSTSVSPSVPVKPTTMQTVSSQAPASPTSSSPASSTAASSTPASSTPASSTPSAPLYTGAASRNVLNMGAVAVGAVALLAF